MVDRLSQTNRFQANNSVHTNHHSAFITLQEQIVLVLLEVEMEKQDSKIK